MDEKVVPPSPFEAPLPKPEDGVPVASDGAQPHKQPLIEPLAAPITAYRNPPPTIDESFAENLLANTEQLVRLGRKYQALLDDGLKQVATLEGLKDIDFAVKRQLDILRQYCSLAKLSRSFRGPTY